jgi:hypothetical protein
VTQLEGPLVENAAGCVRVATLGHAEGAPTMQRVPQGRSRPSPRALLTQRVCGAACRAHRDRKLARKRRRSELAEHREDEATRQRAHRHKAREGRVGPGCHAPASRDKMPDFQRNMVQFVDRALARSRASLLRDLAEFLPRSGGLLAEPGSRASFRPQVVEIPSE